MKKKIYKYITSIWNLIIGFCITLFTAIIASDKTNFVYDFLNKHHYSDPGVQKAALSAIIVITVGILQLTINLISEWIFWVIKQYFKRLVVEVEFKQNKRIKELLKFRPSQGEYKEERVDIELKIVPAGKISMLILKLLGLQIEIFFNPHIIDITLENDKEWLGESASTKLDERQAICIEVLKNYRLGGSAMKPFDMSESIVILPKRVRKETAHIDVKLTSLIGSKVSRALCDFTMKELNIECEGVQ